MAESWAGAADGVNLNVRSSDQARSPLMEATIMPILFWLALLLGYLTGVAAAVLLLPSRLIEPLYGPRRADHGPGARRLRRAATAAPGQAARRQRRRRPAPGAPAGPAALTQPHPAR